MNMNRYPHIYLNYRIDPTWIGTYTNMTIFTENIANPPTPETIHRKHTTNNHNSIKQSDSLNFTIHNVQGLSNKLKWET